MPKLKLTALAAATVTLACLPLTPAVAGVPLLAPWAVGHLVGAAVRLATLPIAITSAASAAAQQPPVAPGAYYGPIAYYPTPEYYPQRGYYAPPASYYGGWQHYYSAPSHYARPAYVEPLRFQPPHGGYYSPSMRYSASYGRPVFNGSRGIANRRW
jgi:hypothetical protein